MKKYYIWIAIIAIFVLPTMAMAGSFVSSLIQGKTPSEAVGIMGEKLDSLFGRVSALEVDQTRVSLNIEQLKLENENLRLKNEVLSKQSENTLTEVTKNKAATDTVNRCIPIEKEMTCVKNAVAAYQEDAKIADLPQNASLTDVLKELGNPWYSKVETDQICILNPRKTPPSGNCKMREEMILQINTERKQKRDTAQGYLLTEGSRLNKLQSSFNDLQCKVILDEYAPGRGPYGCG